MEEANRRVLRPYRKYLPLLPEWWHFRSRMAALDSFLVNYIRYSAGSEQGYWSPLTFKLL
jgi:hypothetical protein